jgi:zinc protease
MNMPILGIRFAFSIATALSVAASGLFAVSLARPAVAADWEQAHSDVPADPAVLYGKLPNGMRYAIMKNATPKGAVAMRLCIDAGSLQETDAQQGLAHFLEHMAFRGSRHVPEDQVWPGMQRLGMEIGADANAATDFTQTIYQFTLPRNDAGSVDAGLLRLRDIASELTLAQRAMDDERGAILSEERLRGTPEYRSEVAQIQQAYAGTLGSRRLPIGKTDVIKNAPIALIRSFYQAYYRPERAVLIVVGDIDPKGIEAKIVAKFSDWKGVGPAGGDPKQTLPAPRPLSAELFAEPGAPSILALNWIQADLPDTKARERTELIERVALGILNYRLQDLASRPQPPFTQTKIDYSRDFHLASASSLTIVTKPQNWQIAVAAATTEWRRLVQFGVTAEEVTRATNNLLAARQIGAAEAATRPSKEVADAFAKSVDERGVIQSPAWQLAFAEETIKGLTAAEINTAIQRLASHGPLVFLSSPTPIEGGKAALSAVVAAAEKTPLTAAKAVARVAWPYTNFGTPGPVVSRTTIDDLQTTFVRFANGVRLTIKPTKFAAGDILVDVRIGNGRLGLPSDRSSPIWAINQGLLQGGLKAIDVDDMSRALAGKFYLVRAGLSDEGMMLWGRTRPADFATELQVLTAYVSAPGWRASAIERARVTAADQITKAEGSPMGVLSLTLPALLRNGDRRWESPSLTAVQALRLEDLKKMVEPRLASAPIEVVVVGDVVVDTVVQTVAATFGALPPRAEPVPPSAAALAVHFPHSTAVPVVLHHNGRADQGYAAIGWPTRDDFDLKTVQEVRVLKEVFATRLMEQLRIRDGATYSPQSDFLASRDFPGYGYFWAATELPPAKMPLFFKVSESIAGELRTHPVSADELQRAVKPSLQTLIADQQKNNYWAYKLLGAQTDARRLDNIRNSIAELKHITPADIQHAAQTYLSDAKVWKAMITPAPAKRAAH